VLAEPRYRLTPHGYSPTTATKEGDSLRHSPQRIHPNYGLMLALALALAGWAALVYLIVDLVT
jgi:hypothetical protein